uniref:Uncharacterized protein n=1 Tax=Rhizophora mucronata TaxID=61149 RepID=A0A2P2QSA6_RHIMU
MDWFAFNNGAFLKYVNYMIFCSKMFFCFMFQFSLDCAVSHLMYG